MKDQPRHLLTEPAPRTEGSTLDAEATTETPRRWRLAGARHLTGGRAIYWWLEIIAVLTYYLVYSTVRNADAEHPERALHHARDLIKIQRALGIYHEQAINQWALHVEPLVVAANYFYGSLHFVVTIGAAVYLFRRFPDDYPLWRNTLAIATALALIGFRFWPVMPPRLLPHDYGFVDTLAKFPTFWSFNSGTMRKISNQYAAMPSIHICWASWCTCVLVPRVKSRWTKVLAALYPALTVAVVVVTANHFFLDAVGGLVILGLGYAAALVLTPAGGRSRGRVGSGPAREPDNLEDGITHRAVGE